MKRLNQKGFTGIEILAVVAITFFLAPLITTVAKPLFNNGAGNTSTQTSSYKETIEPYTVDGKPAAVKLPDGSDALLFKKVTSNDTADQKIMPPAPLHERILAWFLRLGFAGLALALAFPVAAAALWLWIRTRWNNLKQAVEDHKADLEILEADTKKIVIGMEKAFATIPAVLAGAKIAGEVDIAALAEKVELAMKTKLGDFYNDSTKELVKSIKNPS